ncbi:VOC family protein [Levilinea saccharolytica]|uniref:Glyoxalase n=1 Tax=Levilinea saccharolytica TaxID=229921 RepID=A0A0P6YPR5_9CHLR|nr:VOC family protein [Levilinea saccharolytica]KPL84967.1 glyoxalase [Levilinea saccharolytica]GAP18053.1 protein containing glyoxalase-like domain [Levilinea saccharolytica]
MPLHAIERLITFLYTQKLAETAHFYENLLQLRLVLDQGDCRIYETAPRAYVGFCKRMQPEGQTREGVILTLITPDVDDWYRSLCALGAEFEHPPVLNPKYQIYHCFLRDPNGYRIEIQQFIQPFDIQE